MAKAKVIFTKDDILGQESTVMVNLRNHTARKNSTLEEIAKCFKTKLPRGKTYWKLHMTQLSHGDW